MLGLGDTHWGKGNSGYTPKKSDVPSLSSWCGLRSPSHLPAGLFKSHASAQVTKALVSPRAAALSCPRTVFHSIPPHPLAPIHSSSPILQCSEPGGGGNIDGASTAEHPECLILRRYRNASCGISLESGFTHVGFSACPCNVCCHRGFC